MVGGEKEGPLPALASPLALLDALPGAMLYAVDSLISYANEGLGRLLGVAPAALHGRSIFEFLPVESMEALKARHLARSRGEPVPTSYELSVVRADGTHVPADIEVRRLGPREVILLLRDTSDRVRDSALVVALSQVAVRLRGVREVDEVFRVAGEGLAQLGLRFCAFRVRDGALRLTRLEGEPALTEAARGLVGKASVPLPSLGILRVLEARSSLYFDEIRPEAQRLMARIEGVGPEETAPVLEQLAGDKGVFSPLIVQDKPWGGLCFLSASLTARDAAALGLFAAQVALAVEVAEALTRLEALHRDLTAVHAVAQAGSDRALERVLPELLRLAAHACDADVSALYLPGRLPNEMVLSGSHDWPAGGSSERFRRFSFAGILETRGKEAMRPFALSLHQVPEPWQGKMRDQGLLEVALVPLHLENRLVGALSLLRTSARPFSSEDLWAAEVLGSQLSIKLENARLSSEAQRQVRLLSVLFNVSRIGAESVEETPLVEQVLAQVVDVLGVDAASIHLLREGRLELAGHSTQPDVTFDREGLREIAIDTGTLCGRAARSRKTMVASLAQNPGMFSPGVRATGAQHAVAVPMLGAERLLGVLWVSRREDTPFRAEEVRLLESCAGYVGAAVNNARMFEAERRRANELSLISELGERIARDLDMAGVLATGVNALSQIADVPNVFLLLTDPDGSRLRMVASNLPDIGELVIPITDDSVAGAALVALKPVIVEEAVGDPRSSRRLVERFGHRSLMAVPLFAGGKAIGAVVMADRRPRRPSPAEVDRVVAVCNQLGAALGNARVYAEERRRVQDLRLLLDVGRVVTGSLDLDAILAGSVSSLARIVDAHHAFIWLLEPDGKHLAGAATSLESGGSHFREQRLPLDTRAAATLAVRSRWAVRIKDAASDDVHQAMRAIYGMKSLLALPLLLRDEPIGAVVIGDGERTRDWTEAEIERATVMARQVAVAVANARLFEDLKQSYDTLARTQQELVKRERLAALGELAAVVAHEVRNPLGVIFNSLGPIRKSLVPGGEGAMLLDIVGEEADRLNSIVGDLLDFARPNEPSFLVESLEGILRSACEVAKGLAAANEVTIRTEFPLSVPSIRGDGRMLRQVFANLINNAVQSMPRGGEVWVRIEHEVRQQRSGTRVEIADAGPGIPAHLAERIFQPFFTTKASGTGLGLAVVKRIVERHNGEISVQSAAGKGARFVVWLPQ